MQHSTAEFTAIEPTPVRSSRRLKALLAAFAVAAVVACAVGISVTRSHKSQSVEESGKLSANPSRFLEYVERAREEELEAVRGFEKCAPYLDLVEAAVIDNPTSRARVHYATADSGAPPPGTRIILESRTFDTVAERMDSRQWREEDLRHVIVICGDVAARGDQVAYFPKVQIVTGLIHVFLSDVAPELAWHGESRIPGWFAWLVGAPDPHDWFPEVTHAGKIDFYIATEEPVEAFPKLEAVKQSVSINTNGDNDSFQSLKHVGDWLLVKPMPDCKIGVPALETATRIKFREIEQDRTRWGSDLLTEVKWEKLTHVGEIIFNKFVKLHTIHLPALKRVDRFVLVKSAVVSLELPAVDFIGRFVLKHNPSLKHMDMPALTQINYVTMRSNYKYTPNTHISFIMNKLKCTYGDIGFTRNCHPREN